MSQAENSSGKPSSEH